MGSGRLQGLLARAHDGCCRRKDRLRTSRFSATDWGSAAWFKPIPLKLCRGVSRTGLASSRPPAPSRRGRRFWRRWYQLTASPVRPLRRRVARWPPSSAILGDRPGRSRDSPPFDMLNGPLVAGLDVVPGFRWLTSSWGPPHISKHLADQPLSERPADRNADWTLRSGRRWGLWDRRVGGRTRPDRSIASCRRHHLHADRLDLS